MALYLTATRFCVYNTNAIGKQYFRNPPNLYWKQVCDLKTSFFKRLQHNIISKGHKTSSKPTTIQWIIASGGILTTKLIFLPGKFLPIAKCESEAKIVHASADLGTSDNLVFETTKSTFPWLQFLSLLWPHIVSLSIAIVSAMGVAIL